MQVYMQKGNVFSLKSNFRSAENLWIPLKPTSDRSAQQRWISAYFIFIKCQDLNTFDLSLNNIVLFPSIAEKKWYRMHSSVAQRNLVKTPALEYCITFIALTVLCEDLYLCVNSENFFYSCLGRFISQLFRGWVLVIL